MAHKGPQNPERSFGLSVGVVVLAIAAFLIWRGRIGPAGIFAATGAVLVVLGALRPSWLYYPSKAWWRFAIALGYINARIILTVAFTVVLFPISMIWRVIGRDPLQRRRSNWHGWSPYPARYRSPDHFKKMY